MKGSVSIYLVNGIKLQGSGSNHSTSCYSAENTVSQMVYKRDLYRRTFPSGFSPSGGAKDRRQQLPPVSR